MNARRLQTGFVMAVITIAVTGLCGCPPMGAYTESMAAMDDYGNLVPLVQPGYWRIIVRPDEPEFGTPDETAYYIKLEKDEQYVGMASFWGTVEPINNGRFENYRWAQFRPDLKFVLQHGDGTDYPNNSFLADVESSTYLQGTHLNFPDANSSGIRVGEFEMWRVDYVPVENGPGNLVPID